MNDACSNKAFSLDMVGAMKRTDRTHESAMRLLHAAQQLHPGEIGDVSPWAALARYLNESDQTINNWRSRGVPRTRAHELCERIGCRWQWVLTGEGPMVGAESVTDVTNLRPSSSSQTTAAAPHSSTSPAITYEVVKGAVTGVLQALGVRYEDLVEDEGATRRRIEAMLGAQNTDAPAPQDLPMPTGSKLIKSKTGMIPNRRISDRRTASDRRKKGTR